MKISGALLLALTLSASAQVRETAVATAPLGQAEGRQGPAIVASNGPDFFVVWSDDRGGTFGTRVTHDGEVLDKTGIHLSGSFFPIAVLWCGGTYTVVLEEGIDGVVGTSVVRVDVNGKVIDGPRLAARNGIPRAAVTNGSTILIVADSLALLDDRAQLIQQLPSPFPDGNYWAAASNGNTYEIATSRLSDGREWVVTMTLDSDAHVLHTLYLPDAQGQPKIVVTSGKYRVFCESVTTLPKVPQIVTFDASIDPAPVTPFLAIPYAYEVIGTGSNYLLALNSAAATNEIQVYTASGDHIEPAVMFTTTSKPRQALSPAFGVAGDAVLLVWGDYSTDKSDDSELHALILDAAGNARTPAFDLTRSASQQHAPWLATGGANDLVVWQETAGIFAARVTADGTPLDGSGTLLSTTGSAPQVIYDGSKYVVSWAGDRVVDFRWVDLESGVPTNAAVVVDTPNATSYSVGRDALGLVLFFTDVFGVKAERVGLAGAIGPAVQLAAAADAEGVTAAWNGNEWLVVWNDLTWVYPQFGLPFPTGKARAVRLTESLAPLDVAPMEIADSSSADVPPLGTTNGDDFLVAWSTSSGSYARTVSATGTLGDSKLLAAGINTRVKSAAWDGGHYVVAYAMERGPFTNKYTLVLTHVGLEDQLAISTASPEQHEVSIAATPGRPLRAAYTRTATEPLYGYVSRAFTRDLVYARRRIAPH